MGTAADFARGLGRSGGALEAGLVSGTETGGKRIYIYLMLSETGPDGGRIVRSRQAPRNLIEAYETEHPGWYVKDVWSVTGDAAAAAAIAAIKSAYPGRSFP